MNNLINKLKERAATYKQFGIDPTTQELLEKAAEVLGGSCQGTLSSIPRNSYIKIESKDHLKYVEKLASKSGFKRTLYKPSVASLNDINYLYFDKYMTIHYGECISPKPLFIKEILVDMDTGVVTYVD